MTQGSLHCTLPLTFDFLTWNEAFQLLEPVDDDGDLLANRARIIRLGHHDEPPTISFDVVGGRIARRAKPTLNPENFMRATGPRT